MSLMRMPLSILPAQLHVLMPPPVALAGGNDAFVSYLRATQAPSKCMSKGQRRAATTASCSSSRHAHGSGHHPPIDGTQWIDHEQARVAVRHFADRNMKLFQQEGFLVPRGGIDFPCMLLN
jgi:hypothetical protein